MSTRWAELLLFIAVVAQLFCLTASTTSASRMMFAFSRDGAVPGWRVWRKVARNRVPWAAVLAIGVLSWLLMVPTLWNAVVGYLVGTSVAVIGLYIAFAIPIWLRWRKGESFERRAWHLGSHYKWMDPVALAWITLICILFILLPMRLFAHWTWGLGVHPLRRLVPALCSEVVQGPGADGHRRGARAARGGAARPVRAADRVAGVRRRARFSRRGRPCGALARSAHFAEKTWPIGSCRARPRPRRVPLRRARGAGGRNHTGRLYAEAEGRPGRRTKAARLGEILSRACATNSKRRAPKGNPRNLREVPTREP